MPRALQVTMEQFVTWWVKHKEEGDFDQPAGAAAGGSAAGSGLSGMFSRFGRKKKRDANKIYPEPIARPGAGAKPALP